MVQYPNWLVIYNAKVSEETKRLGRELTLDEKAAIMEPIKEKYEQKEIDDELWN